MGDEKLEEGQGHQYESLQNLVSNLESQNDELTSNEKWFNRIRRRIKLSHRPNVNRRRLVPVEEETYDDNEQDDIVNTVVSNVLQNNRRRLDLSNRETRVVDNVE